MIAMITSFITGLLLGLSLIVAIGAQNVFVLRQGLIQEHVFFIALFCALSDSILIILGVVGISYFLGAFITEFSKIIYALSALWLISYSILRFLSALKNNSNVYISRTKSMSLFSAFSTVAIFTFANPHVYLDTMILIGSVSQKFIGNDKIYFTLGACFASFIWFFGIAYGAKLLIPLMQNSHSWRIFDFLIALIMFAIALNLLYVAGWF
jgi:L-lysine exporter family protein LysE/ArgO